MDYLTIYNTQLVKTAMARVDFNRQSKLAEETFKYNMLGKVYDSASYSNGLTEQDILTDESNLLKLLVNFDSSLDYLD